MSNDVGRYKIIYKYNHLKSNYIQKLLRDVLDRRILRQLDELIVMAQKLGLPEKDVENSLIDIEYNECELAFETIVSQMYEYDLKINEEFYNLAMTICETLKIDKQKFNFLNELKEKR